MCPRKNDTEPAAKNSRCSFSDKNRSASSRSPSMPSVSPATTYHAYTLGPVFRSSSSPSSTNTTDAMVLSTTDETSRRL